MKEDEPFDERAVEFGRKIKKEAYKKNSTG
jgi:hypothetical protein